MTLNKHFENNKLSQLKNKILKKYSLERVKMIGSSGNFDTTKCIDKDGNFYIIKIRRQNLKETKQKFLREVMVTKFLSQTKAKGIQFVDFISAQTNQEPEWMIYKFIEGQELGNWNDFYPKMFEKTNKNIYELLTALWQIKIDSPLLKKVRYKETLAGFNSYKKILKKYLSKKEIVTGKKIIKKNKQLLNNTNLVLTHADLHPANIILTKDHKVSVIDWFDAQKNNLAYDSCFLWFKLSSQPQKQEEFLKKITSLSPKKEEFQKLFHINIIRLTPKMLQVADDIKRSLGTEDQKEIKKTDALIDWLINNYKKNI